MSTTKANPDILRLGAQRIRDGGLAKRAFSDDDGSFCALGSLDWQLRGWVNLGPELELLGELLGLPSGTPCMCGCGYQGELFQGVTCWNDEPERTAEDVIGLLERAAEKAEANR